jgi:hypothetical protein
MVLVAAALGDQGWAFSFAAVGVTSLAVGVLYLLFPQGPLFGLGVATSLAVTIREKPALRNDQHGGPWRHPVAR